MDFHLCITHYCQIRIIHFVHHSFTIIVKSEFFFFSFVRHSFAFLATSECATIIRNHCQIRIELFKMEFKIRRDDGGRMLQYGVGVGVFILNPKHPGKIVIGERKGSHGSGQWALPGGHLVRI